jgi:hypothetical protein
MPLLTICSKRLLCLESDESVPQRQTNLIEFPSKWMAS